MAKKQSRSKKKSDGLKDEGRSKKSTVSRLKDDTKNGVYAILCFAFALFFILTLWKNAGVAGDFFYNLFSKLLGVGYYLIPFFAIVLGISFTRSIRPNVALTHTIGTALFFISILGIVDIVAFGTLPGGYVGRIIAWPFVALFDVYASILFLGALLIISLFVLFDTRPNLMRFVNRIQHILFGKEIPVENETLAYVTPQSIPVETKVLTDETQKEDSSKKKKESSENSDEGVFIPAKQKMHSSAYTPPPLSLLEQDRGKPNVGDIKANANIIQRTLANFGIIVEMDEITTGPTVTRYALKPAQGVKLSRIAALQNDLALALAAHPIRMELPIPGKSLVGIEIPNKTKSTVGLGTMLGETAFINSVKPLMFALGRNVAGKSTYVNLAKAPHALIAGTTGSGKSVTIHALITSLLYRNGPEDLKFIMADPKRVELTLYNKIPHLLTPVITDAKKCILALKWAAKEMDRRYDLLQSHSVRDIESYHDNIFSKRAKDSEDVTDRLPYIVIIIDELADIMQAYPRELEAAIVRLAQMSRAVGIHLVLSTQRPEVNIITGLIKANVPTRIALRVPTQIDSRTILDTGGAEKLLGAGDMLFSGGEGQPERLQSAFISEDEVKKVVKYLSEAFKNDVPGDDIAFSGPLTSDPSIFSANLESDDSADDDLYEQARQIVIESQKASTSYLQRKLGIGYARAARLVDMLEERGVVGAGNGAKPREVLEKTAEAEQTEYSG